ncbi:4-coumarate--CoA ligase [Coemansia sp. RSA 1285]|nr:4-coumarate--CoA ligase [Coemansia sp. RSA 1804]KAJ2687568.1 4-coumarate--CoA ligase [Coemansia sp. RSA 1285]
MVFRGIIPPVDIPGYDITTFYIGAAKQNAPSEDTLAYHDIGTGESLTFGRLGNMYQQIGSGLVNKLGVKPGDVVAIFASNTIYYAPAFFGTVSTGAVFCTVSSTFQESELQYQLDDCNAQYLFVGVKQVPIVRTAMAKGLLRIPKERIIVLESNNELAPANRFVSISQLFCDQPFEQKRIVDDKSKASNTLAVIVYSSGTTGLPKGVMLSHRNLIGYTLQSVAIIKFYGSKQSEELGIAPSGPPQRAIAVLPFAHIHGFTMLIANSVAGGKTQFILNDYSIDRFLQAIQDYRIQVTNAVPSVLNQIVHHKNIGKYDLSHLHAIGSGGAPLPRSVHATIKSRFSVNAVNGYGISEACSGVCLMTNYMFLPGSVGFLYPGIEAKFLDPETGKEMGVGERGELCIRGITVMMGYLNRPKETADAIDSDGFLHTGDIGYINETGHVFITDRIKELIKYKGLQIAPAELESLLMDHPRVADAAVVGVNDKKRDSEVPRAFVVPDDLGLLLPDV